MRSLATDHKSSQCGRDNELRMQLDKGEFCLARELIFILMDNVSAGLFSPMKNPFRILHCLF